jgi:LPS O-antigen subunit length determinant protein (WzzB/FepE family)
MPAPVTNEAGRASPVQTAFPYTREDIFSDYASYLRNPAHLLKGVEESGIGSREGNEAERNAGKLSFVRSISFVAPTDKDPGLKMRVRAGDQQALNRFVSWSLDHASVDVAQGIKAAVVRRIEAGKKLQNDRIAQLRVEIASLKAKADMSRKDEVAVLTEQAKIAESLGIKEPIALLSARGQSASGASAQVFSGEQPAYYQGSAALEERIDLLKNRKDVDPFILDLRDLERQVYVLENDTSTERLSQLLEQSPLNDPATAPMVEYSTIGASAVKVFPRVSLFGAGSLLIGLILGAAMVLLRTGFAKRP